MSLRPQIEHVSQRYLKCGNCNNEYDENDRQPRILPCLHSWCDKCLRDMNSRDSVKCSECKESYSVPNGDITSFRIDESRGMMINYFKVQTKTDQIFCEECLLKKRAFHRCKECGQFLCQDCTDAHKRTKVTKTHAVPSIEELMNGTIEEYKRVQTCSVSGHEQQPFTFYCSSKSCDWPVCALCAVSEHQAAGGHVIHNIADVYMDTRRSVDSLLSEVKHRQLSVEGNVNIIEELRTKLDTTQAVVEKEIDVVFEFCQSILDRRRNELKNKLFDTVKAKKTQIAEQFEKLTTYKTNLSDATEFCGSVCSYSTPSEFLLFKDLIQQRLMALIDKSFDPIPQVNMEIKFKQEGLREKYRKLMTQAGKVWTPSVCIKNTEVVPRDVIIEKEGTALTIVLYDADGRILKEGDVDVCVEVIDPESNVCIPEVKDYTQKEGCYKMFFVGKVPGRHNAHVRIMGQDVRPKGYDFNVLPEMTAEGGSTVYDVKGLKSASTTIPGGKGKSRIPGVDTVFGNLICPEFVFNSSIAHATVEVSDDGKYMTSKRIKRQYNGTNNSKESDRLLNYKGTMGSIPFYKAGLFYFELGTQYKILRLLRQNIVFEVALARLDVTDKHYSVDCYPYAWSVSARGCHVCGKVCLQTWHNGLLKSHNALTPRTPSLPGTMVKLHYGFLLDTIKHHWIIVDIRAKKVIFHFKNLVVSELSEPLWPLFGIYNSDMVSVIFQLFTGSDIKNIPETVLDAIVF